MTRFEKLLCRNISFIYILLIKLDDQVLFLAPLKCTLRWMIQIWISLSLRFIRRLTPYNVSVRTWASCAVELTSGLELITSFRLLRFYFSSNFYVSYIIGKLGICSFQRYATLKNLSSRKGAVISWVRYKCEIGTFVILLRCLTAHSIGTAGRIFTCRISLKREHS